MFSIAISVMVNTPRLSFQIAPTECASGTLRNDLAGHRLTDYAEGPRVRISLPPAESRGLTRVGPPLRLFLGVRQQRIALPDHPARIRHDCRQSCPREST